MVLSTLAVLGTGVGLIIEGRGDGTLLTLHKASFVVWIAFTGVHVLAYVLRVPRLASADWRRAARYRLPGGPARQGVVLGSLLVGIVLGAVALSYAGSWTHGHHDDDGRESRRPHALSGARPSESHAHTEKTPN